MKMWKKVLIIIGIIIFILAINGKWLAKMVNSPDVVTIFIKSTSLCR